MGIPLRAKYVWKSNLVQIKHYLINIIMNGVQSGSIRQSKRHLECYETLSDHIKSSFLLGTKGTDLCCSLDRGSPNASEARMVFVSSPICKSLDFRAEQGKWQAQTMVGYPRPGKICGLTSKPIQPIIPASAVQILCQIILLRVL